MTLPNAYVQTGRIEQYFEAMVNAEAPNRFSQRFLEQLGFTSKNDRAFIGLLKELGFLDGDGKPTDRYYRFLDKSQWHKIVAEGVKESYSELFAINKDAHTLSRDEVRNKLRTLYSGQKKDSVIGLIAKTFEELATVGDFSSEDDYDEVESDDKQSHSQPQDNHVQSQRSNQRPLASNKIGMSSLQYHINIVLPESRDQAVYDAIFRSLREHLG